jgi:hypothetical protein
LNLQEQLVSQHRQWLTGFDRRHLKSWEDQLSNDPEAALCEAAVRDIMQGFGFVVEPVVDLGREANGAVQRPDFRCSNGIGTFYVEVTNISIAKATELTNLPHPEQTGSFTALDQTDPERFASLKDLETQYLAKISRLTDRHKVPVEKWDKAIFEIISACRLLMTESTADPRSELLEEKKSWPSGADKEWLLLYGGVSSLLDRGVNRDNAQAFTDRLIAQFERDAKGQANSGDTQMSLPI